METMSASSAIVDDIDDELAKKIAVAAVVVMLYHDNNDQEGVTQKSSTSESHGLSIESAIPSPAEEQLINNPGSIEPTSSVKSSISSHVSNENQHVNMSPSFTSSNEPTVADPLHNSAFPNASQSESSAAAPNNSELSTVLAQANNADATSSKATYKPNGPITPVRPIMPTSNNSELSTVLAQANNADSTSSKATYKPLGPITPVRPTKPTPPVSNGNKELLTKAKAETTTAVKERTNNQSINLTENFKKRNALTAELQSQAINQKSKLGSLLDRLKKNRTNLSISLKPVVEPAVELDAGPVVEPTQQPVMGSVSANKAKNQFTLNKLNANLLKSLPQDRRKMFTPTPHQRLRNKLLRLHDSIEKTIHEIEKYLRQMNMNDQSLHTEKSEILSDYIVKLNAFLSQLNVYMTMNLTYQDDKELQNIMENCRAIIERVNNIIYSSGGKRRTHKKRKQKKQKKRFGTHKK